MRGELQGKQVVQVAAGDRHSACVTEDGSMYMWGDNDSGQLGGPGRGHGRPDDANLPVFFLRHQCKCKVRVVPITIRHNELQVACLCICETLVL